VENLQKRSRGEDVTPRLENAEHFSHGSFGPLQMLEDRLTVQDTDRGSAEGKLMRVTDNVHVWKRCEVQVQEARMCPQRPSPNRNRRAGAFRDRDFESFARAMAPRRLDFAEPTCKRPRATVLVRESP
jgi:hypothetical protein